MEPASTPIKSLDENNITSLHAVVQSLVKSNAEVLRRLTEIEKHTFEVSQLHKRIEDLKRDCEHDRRRIVELEDRIDLYEGHSRDSSIEIQGAPITENEDLYEHVQKLGQKVDVTINRNDISHCYRIKTINTTNAYAKTQNRIIVRFVHKYKRHLFLKQSRKKMIRSRCCLRPSSTYQVHLCLSTLMNIYQKLKNISKINLSFCLFGCKMGKYL
ncbi:unnamed protein product [Chilo suppressalis]|uniref:Uncharacterized protein n=1 Tax=Chilo suppressalis TaxID=168631 RepID=A0ABN8B9L7_CHISP|nr:unnamed protein product [Chilo suppressalis]